MTQPQPAAVVPPTAPIAPAAVPAPPAQPAPADTGYPENTPVVEMTPVQQAAYWKHMARKHEGRANSQSDYADLKAKADELDRVKAAQMSEQEKAVAAAKAEGQTAAEQAAAAKYGAQLAAAEIRIAAAGRIPDKDLVELLEDIALPKFLNTDGTVNADKVTAFVNKVAPAGTAGGQAGQQQRRGPDMGQGRREASSMSARDAGRAEAQKRFGTASAGAA